MSQPVEDEVSNSEDEPPCVFRVTTAQAAAMLGWDHNKLWRLVGTGKLSAPVRLSPRHCLWAQSEIEALGGKWQQQDRYTFSRTHAARLLGVCRETISRLVADNVLPAKRKNGRLYFRPEDLSAAKKQRTLKKRLDWLETSALVGLDWRDIRNLMWAGAFPRHDYRQRFQRGEVLAWCERYQRTGSLTGDPSLDERFRRLKPALKQQL